MAGIDKTYIDNYKEYKEFKDWANNQFVTFFNGYKDRIGDWVWYYEEEDFENGEIPIMNSPNWLDAFLIKNCKIEFVVNRMKNVHSEKFVKDSFTADFQLIPKGFEKNRKIHIKIFSRTKFPIHNKPYSGKTKWWLSCLGDFQFHTDTGVWTHNKHLYPYDTNVSHVTSLKSLVRHLRKQYLPKNAQFYIYGRYVGETYLVELI